MAITFFGAASVPADGASATNTADPTAFSNPPIASMTAGDLAIIYAAKRNATGTISISNTGGQSWTDVGSVNSSGGTLTGNAFWCTFNGTWSAAPSVSFSATTNNTVVMIVFRPDGTTYTWGYDTYSAGTASNPSLTSFAAIASPGSTWITPPTPTHDNNITIAGWNTDDDNTWGTLTGAGWSKTGLSAQYRNTSGSDTSQSFAYLIQTTAQQTTNVTQTELTLGNDGGLLLWITFYEIPPVVTIPNKIHQCNQAINRASTY